MPQTKTLPKGLYWIGDLCYVLKQPGNWDDLLDISCPKGGKLRSGVHELPDGRKFGLLKTSYGDGGFLDQFNKEYCVDSGMIGCINMKDLPDDIRTSLKNTWTNPFELGHTTLFPTDIEVKQSDGILKFGKGANVIVINTN